MWGLRPHAQVRSGPIGPRPVFFCCCFFNFFFQHFFFDFFFHFFRFFFDFFSIFCCHYLNIMGKKIGERRLMWYGHVARGEEDHYLKMVANMEIPGRRRRGRPKTRWKDSVRRDMEEVGLTPDIAQERNTWRRTVKDHCSDPK